jgi:hypothetical protein
LFVLFCKIKIKYKAILAKQNLHMKDKTIFILNLVVFLENILVLNYFIVFNHTALSIKYIGCDS